MEWPIVSNPADESCNTRPVGLPQVKASEPHFYGEQYRFSGVTLLEAVRQIFITDIRDYELLG